MLNAKKSRLSHGKAVLKLVLALLILSGSLHAQMFWNHAARFDGTGYIACPNTLSLNIIGSVTVEAWVYPETNTGIRYIVFKGNSSNGYYLRINSNGTVSLGTNGLNRITSTAVIPAGKWSHIAGSYNVSNNGYKLFVNGLEDASTINIINSAPNSNTDSLLIGKFGANTFTGLIDEVRIWTKAVSADNIRRNMHTSLSLSSGPYVALLFSMPFQKVNSTGTVFTLSDLSLNPISANIGFNRGVTDVDLGNAPSVYLSSNEALLLEGNNDSYAAIPSNGLNDITGAMTLEAWIMPAGPSGVNQYIFHKHNAGIGLRFMLNSSQKLSFSLNASQFYEGSTPLTYNRWYHAAWVISQSGASSLYINGVLDAYYANTGFPNSNNDSMYIGRGFNGQIDEARVFKYERTAAEINNFLNVSMDAANIPAGTGFSFNLDGSAWANSNFQFLFLRGNTYFSAPAALQGGSSPIMRADNINFQHGFYQKNTYKRIPQTGSTGSMIDDSIVIPDNVSISDVNVYVSLNHGEIGEIDIRLISPTGWVVTLMDGFGLRGPGSNLTTIFDDQADSSLITDRYLHVSPRVKPTGSINSSLQGLNSGGVWRLWITDAGGLTTGALMSWGLQINNSPVIGLQNVSTEVPESFSLAQNYPNPFNPVTNIGFRIAEFGFVTMKVYDITGKEIAVLVNEELRPGVYNVDFDGSDLSSGTYFYRIEANGITDVKKMILVK